MIDEENALMFGGILLVSGSSADVYVLHLPTMVSSLLQLLHDNLPLRTSITLTGFHIAYFAGGGKVPYLFSVKQNFRQNFRTRTSSKSQDTLGILKFWGIRL